MAIARLLDVRHGDGIITAADLNQEHYVNWTRFLRYCASNGLCTIVASNYGNNGGAGTGEDYHDGVNPALDNAFIYAEFDVGVQLFGVLVQWADAVAFGTAPGNPGLIDAATLDGVAIAMAFREDGTSPWGGTTGDTGANTKGATVWTPGTSTVHAFPMSNSPGGSHNTNKENMRKLADDLNLYSRAHWVANSDGIFCMFSLADDGLYTAMYLGRYTPRSGLTIPTDPYCMIHRSSTGMWASGVGTNYGTTTGNGTNEGGIVGDPANGVVELAYDVANSGQFSTTVQPNNLISPAEFEGGAFSVYQKAGTFGLAGYLPTALVASFYGTANHNTNAAADRAYAGHTTIAIQKWGISWDGGAVPGTNNNRTGRLSYTP